MDKYTRKDFDSVGDMLHFAMTCGYACQYDASAWAGGRNLAQTVHYIREGGDPRETAKAQALVDKIDATFRDRSKEEWTPAPYGAYPVVPDYLAGDPFSMRTKVRTVSDIAPIKLVIEHGVNHSISATQVLNRSAAIAALAQRLSEMRPVELWLSSNSATTKNRQSLMMVKLDASPVNIGQLAALFSPSGLRILGLTITDALCENRTRDLYPFRVGNVHVRGPKDVPRFTAAARERMGLHPQDVYVPIALRNSEITDNPEAWVNKQLEAQREIIE